jgi:CheY-like chemotaxis protein
MKNLRSILLAEDNPNDIELILDALLKKKLVNRVDVVNDGVEVLEFLRYEGKYKMRCKQDPAVIILDVKMPRMNGIEVLREIRNDADLKFIPIVMLTSSNDEPDLKVCYELGVNAYVVKPLDFNEFIDAVTDLGMFWALLNEIPDRDTIINLRR